MVETTCVELPVIAGDPHAGRAGRHPESSTSTASPCAQLDRSAELSDAIGDPLEQHLRAALEIAEPFLEDASRESATRLIRVPSHAADRLSWCS